MRRFLILNLIFFTLTVHAQEVKFEISKYIIGSVEGKFTDVDYKVSLNRGDLSKSTIEGEVNINSIDTGNEDRDGKLLSKNWFDTKQYPRMKMKIQNITQNDEYSFSGIATVEIKGIRRDIPVEFTEMDGKFASSFAINRKEFNIIGSKAGFLVGRKVEILLMFPIQK